MKLKLKYKRRHRRLLVITVILLGVILLLWLSIVTQFREAAVAPEDRGAVTVTKRFGTYELKPEAFNAFATVQSIGGTEANYVVLFTQSQVPIIDPATGAPEEIDAGALNYIVRPETEIILVETPGDNTTGLRQGALSDITPGSELIVYTDTGLVSYSEASSSDPVEALFIEILPPGGDPRI